MKYVVILLLLATLTVIIYWRLRPYLKVARNVLSFIKDVRAVSSKGVPINPGQERQERIQNASESLLKCVNCGTWLPASRAVSIRSSSQVYCSHQCLEQSAHSDTKPKSASR